ncbi:MAG: T9SS type A sorting domain-containing protein [Chlorobi bacterium]|nr:T9SS type A sorting domain-containing protein [Chlorobiota bacterium]
MKNYKSNTFQINTTDFENGIYLIKIKDSKGNLLKTEKFVKE